MAMSKSANQSAVASTSQSLSKSSQPAASSSQQQSTAASSSSGQPATQPEDPFFGPLEKASKVLDDRLARDDRWQGIGESLTAASSSDYILPPNPAWLPFQRSRSVHIPDRLFQDHTVGSNWAMGLLPEIERAWVTIDNKLFLWDWVDGTSISTFEELNDIIVGVGIVKPRPGVFVDTISHLLVLNTPNQVNLVGIGFPPPAQPGSKPELTFYLTELSVSTEGVSLTKVKGTSSGRIFLASSPEPLTPGGIGGDGCLYELVYQSAEGWFSKKCTLYNRTSGSIANSIMPSFLRGLSAVPKADWIVDLQVDDERGLLYCLLRNGAIEMFSVPPATTSGSNAPPSRLAKASDIQRQALVILPGNPMVSASKFKVVALQVIPVREAGNGKIALVAISNTGVRLYFTHQRRGYSYYASSSHPLELCHVRPPPAPASQQQQQAQPTPNYFGGQQVMNAPSQQQLSQASGTIPFNNVSYAVFSSGGLFVASNPLADMDAEALLVTSPDIAASARSIAENQPPALQRPFTEIAGTLEVPSETCAIAEVRSTTFVPGPTGLNELATQISVPRREWVVLTKTSANVIVRQRPVDTLRDIIEGLALNASGGQGEIGIFFESYGRDQACAMLLALAADNSRVNLSKPSPHVDSFQGIRQTSVSLADQAKSLFFEGGGRPISFDRGGFTGSVPSSTASDSKVVYSGRHEGLAFYFARLVRAIWKSKVTLLRPEAGNPNKQVSALSDAVLSSVQRDLLSLRSFVEQEYHIFTQLPDDARSTMNSSAYQAEQKSIAALRQLLTQAVEAISFVLLLIDYRISDIIGSCSPEDQKAIVDLTFQTLITTKKGRDMARSLVSAVINQQIGRQLSVDAISDTLQQRCGSFCSADDVLLYKAIEATRRAKDTTVSSERLDSLRESLRLFTKASSHLSHDRLKDICGEYNDLNYPLGVVDLCLACAESWDTGKRGLGHWLDGCPPNDPRAATYDLRKRCYSLVFEGLERTDIRLNDAANPTKPSKPNALSFEEADGIRTNAYNKALSSQDELFHQNMYDWFISRGMTDQLLEIRTPFIESYLSRDASYEKTDLLWQYYVRTGSFAKAGEVLAALAETILFPLSLYKRVEYLSLSVSNFKSAPAGSSAYIVQQASETEEKLEVGQVQVEIYRAIEDTTFDSDDEKRAWLSKAEDRLFNISELYQLFVDPLDLKEIALLVFHVSDHRDTELVLTTWEDILARVQARARPEAKFEAVRAKLVELTRRFCTSDVSFPLPQLVILLSTWTLDNRSIAPSSWLPIAFNEAGVPWEALFATYDDLTVSRVPPFHTSSSLGFLLRDASVVVESWLERGSHSHSVAFGRFPAAEVDAAIGRYLISLDGLAAAEPDDKQKVEARLKECQRRLRRDY